jgi:aspartyl-tRNA(Asn)/glutamyl-tRNA(Gln) amidotransferase subunit B
MNAVNGVIIGLEVHVQLNKLRSKLFCPCSTQYHDSLPNTHVCPTCLGLPGALPRINRSAVECAIKVALALNCDVQEKTLFYRKNYFYPDLPRGFQISQYDFPLASGGTITIDAEDGSEKKVRITRVHMEEDPGRLAYKGAIDAATYSLVDYNRSGMSLLEVVTEPDMNSPKEARRFLNKLRSILEYLDVFDGNLEGAMRVDANISLAGGARAEVKNISSYKGVEKALLFEITRQRNLRRRGVKIVQETRHFDEARGVTMSLRMKETEEDYRYFPEPDLVPMKVKDWTASVKLPELPEAKRARFVKQYGISDYHAKVLTSELKLANFFEKVASQVDAKLAATWIADVLKGELNYRDEHFIATCKIAEKPEIVAPDLKELRVQPDLGVTFRPDLTARDKDGRMVLIEVNTDLVDKDDLLRIKRQIEIIRQKYPKENIRMFLAGSSLADDVEDEMGNLGINFCQISVEELIAGKSYDVDLVKPEYMIDMLRMLQSGEITEKGAVEVIRTLLDEGGTPRKIIERKGLSKVGVDEVDKAIMEVVQNEGQKAMEDYRSGKAEALNFIVGQVMKKTRGRADAAYVRKKLEEIKE